jgi:pSer/pThr/pTyr-binding forkhead associated (FHA) protein
MRTRLLAKNPIDRKTREFTLTEADVSIGSEQGNTLQLRHETISRRHAVIAPLGSSHEVRDLNSTNGTFVNEQRIQRPTLLKNGDHIRFGAVSFVYAGEGAKSRRIGIVQTIEALLILLGLGFGLTEYLLNWQSIDTSVGASTHREIATGTTVQTRSQPSCGTTANAKPVRAISVARTSAAIMPEPSRDIWLQRINFYRAMAGLDAVRNDAGLSGGCLNHARYLLENYAAIIKGGGILGGAGHEEQPDKKDYTADGANCAGNGDVAWGCGPFVDSDAVDHWVEGPFHRLGLLNPALDSAGFGEFQDDGCWASAVRLPPHQRYERYEHPIEFPPNGSAIALTWRGGEWPNPLDGCPGYSEPVGLPITLQLGHGFYPDLASHSLTQDGVALEHCAYNAKGYATSDQYIQEYARQVLHSFSAIVLIPRNPLVAGKTYAVSITADGQGYKWSFTTAASGP